MPGNFERAEDAVLRWFLARGQLGCVIKARSGQIVDVTNAIYPRGRHSFPAAEVTS